MSSIVSSTRASESASPPAARARATAVSTVVAPARASPSQAATTASTASSSASAPSKSRPRRISVRRLSGDKGCSRHREVRLNRGGFTSKKGFSVVAPMSTTSPSSTAGNSTSCWDLLKRCTSSMKSMVPLPCSPRRRWASARASRTSLTPAAVAESVIRCLAVVSASRRARLVLPVPAGPHRIDDPTRSDSASRRKGAPGPMRCSWPTTSSRVRGRRRAARGAWRWRRRSAASAKRLSGCPRSSRAHPAAPPHGCPARPGRRRAAAWGRPSTGRRRTGSWGTR